MSPSTAPNIFTQYTNLPKSLRMRLLVGLGGAILILALLIGVFWSMASAAASFDPGNTSSPDIAHLVRMTSIQAGLTTVLSLFIGTAIAWALNRLRFPGRAALAALFGTAIVTPGIVLAFGLIAVWGRAGWLNDFLSLFGLSMGSGIFGLGGILLAHTILDAAFAARILLARLESIPHQRLKMGRSLALNPWQRFVIIDWPAIAGALPGVGAIIFLLAFTSFPIVLLMGGGPANQTLEVAIYAAVRLNFDLTSATQIALIQILVCSVVLLPSAGRMPTSALAGVTGGWHWPDRGGTKWVQIAILIVATCLFITPLLAILSGLIDPALSELVVMPRFWKALANSLMIGAASAILTTIVAILFSLARAAAPTTPYRLAIGLPILSYLAVPGIVTALGFFLISRNLGLPASTVAPYVLILANTLLSLPFALTTLGPTADTIMQKYARLSRSLGLSTSQRFLQVEWPLLARDAGLVFALGFCFSLGDLSVIALFGTDDFTTLPWLMYRALGAYRTHTAAGIAGILLIITFVSFWGLPRLADRLFHAQD